ncbi:OmpH family outer membrane protein [Sporohalobacter salinus]|uniref:OmpH family outer membrane protein n=1 Tax=Sporohalobacter salinus TaxID=1494606 RepID=UPI0019604434|nr:OmpH family outer membrane protein [Sporohalobacter salinus]MBM7622916.1 outer membrane protein [Sporohalobacter salinus]
MLQEKKLIKILALTLVLSVGVGAVFFLSPQVKAKSEVEKAVAYVDFDKILKNHPKRDEIDTQFKQYFQSLKKQLSSELQSKVKDVSGKERQKLLHDYNQKLKNQIEQKKAELLQPLKEDINTTIKEVADQQGVAVVLHKETVIYGGNDLTDKVLSAIKKKEEKDTKSKTESN